MSFSDQLQHLQAFLDADDLHDEALDYMAACGYLTALAISPEVVEDAELLAELFAETPDYQDAEQQAQIESTLLELKARIARELASDEDLELPCELTLGDEPDYSDLRSWCIGFMEGVFLREEAWFSNDEELVSELMLTIMVASCLFADQPEFAEIHEDEDMVEDMAEHIPQVLTQLFLLFNAPEEKQKPALITKRR
jgi:uncharacterized protein